VNVVVTARLHAAYVANARRLLREQEGTLLRFIRDPTRTALGAGPVVGDWKRPLGLYAALGGFLAAFQHGVQRHLFQGRAVDLTSSLLFGVYLGVGLLGVCWVLGGRDPKPDRCDPRSRTTP
jgi:hypothetical protein